ncbi:Caffeoyl-CoA O-methyltransferase, partial [Mucuna pruriens]
MLWHVERMVRWAEDLITHGGKKVVDPSMGSPVMEIKKFTRSYSQSLEVMMEHAVYQLLHVLEFSSFCKRMSVIVKNEENQLLPSKDLDRNIMATLADEGQLLSMLIKLMNAKNRMEIGAYTGDLKAKARNVSTQKKRLDPEGAVSARQCTVLQYGISSIEEVQSSPTLFEIQSSSTLFETESSPTPSKAESSLTLSKVEFSSTLFEAESNPTLFEAESSPTLSEVESSPTLYEAESSSTLFEVESSLTLPKVESSPTPSKFKSSPTLSKVESMPLSETESKLSLFGTNPSPFETESESPLSETGSVRIIVGILHTLNDYISPIGNLNKSLIPRTVAHLQNQI